ncbi:MAG: hypothetical protein Q8P92_00440 [Candidatus Daviesbacteria bacterium]|nr:hypothetical protein [Candidatus Daviesbacteria bacterium]
MSSEFVVEQIDVVGNRGLCGGVKMAFEGADQAKAIVDEFGKSSRIIYLTWDLVNNEPVMNMYRERGFKTFEDLVKEAHENGTRFNTAWDLLPKRSVVLGSAHGDQPVFFEKAAKGDHYFLNLACQLVKKVNRLALDADVKGELVFYAGKIYPDGTIHPETTSSLSRIKSENQILLDETQLKDLSDIDLRAYLKGLNLPRERTKEILSQTTLSPRYLDRLYAAVAEVYPETIFRDREKGDLCPAMRNRSLAAYQTLPTVDMWLVVGSKHSHNSQELKESGTEQGVPSYSIDYPHELDLEWFNPAVKKVGITSGASVPDWVLTPVIDRLTSINPSVRINWLDQVVKELNKTFVLPQKEIDGLKDWLLAEATH